MKQIVEIYFAETYHTEAGILYPMIGLYVKLSDGSTTRLASDMLVHSDFFNEPGNVVRTSTGLRVITEFSIKSPETTVYNE